MTAFETGGRDCTNPMELAEFIKYDIDETVWIPHSNPKMYYFKRKFLKQDVFSKIFLGIKDQ